MPAHSTVIRAGWHSSQKLKHVTHSEIQLSLISQSQRTKLWELLDETSESLGLKLLSKFNQQ